MTTQPPYDPPREEVFVAFVEALEAWERIEDEMMLLFGNIGWSTDFSRTWSEFYSTKGLPKQCIAIRDQAIRTLRTDSAKQIAKMTEKLERLATRRNYIVHGRWRTMRCVEEADAADGAERIHRLLYREYVHPDEPGGFVPTTAGQEGELRAKGLRHHPEDLVSLRDNLSTFRREISILREQIIREVAPKL